MKTLPKTKWQSYFPVSHATSHIKMTTSPGLFYKTKVKRKWCTYIMYTNALQRLRSGHKAI